MCSPLQTLLKEVDHLKYQVRDLARKIEIAKGNCPTSLSMAASRSVLYTPSLTGEVMGYTNVSNNSNGAWNPITGRYTVNEPGVYLVAAAMSYNNATTTIQYGVLVDAAPYPTALAYEDDISGLYDVVDTGSVVMLIRLRNGQTVSLYVKNTTNSMVLLAISSFTIARISR